MIPRYFAQDGTAGNPSIAWRGIDVQINYIPENIGRLLHRSFVGGNCVRRDTGYWIRVRTLNGQV